MYLPWTDLDHEMGIRDLLGDLFVDLFGDLFGDLLDVCPCTTWIPLTCADQCKDAGRLLLR